MEKWRVFRFLGTVLGQLGLFTNLLGSFEVILRIYWIQLGSFYGYIGSNGSNAFIWFIWIFLTFVWKFLHLHQDLVDSSIGFEFKLDNFQIGAVFWKTFICVLLDFDGYGVNWVERIGKMDWGWLKWSTNNFWIVSVWLLDMCGRLFIFLRDFWLSIATILS